MITNRFSKIAIDGEEAGEKHRNDSSLSPSGGVSSSGKGDAEGNRRSPVLEDLLPFAFEDLRSKSDVMLSVYSFLTIRERVRLSEVNKAFRDDPGRGRIVAVYGPQNVGIDEALKSIRDYIAFDGTPLSLDAHGSLGYRQLSRLFLDPAIQQTF